MNRRRFLQVAAAGLGSVALGRFAVALAQGGGRDLIVVSNAGGEGPSVSVIDAGSARLLVTLPFPASYSFPANRWQFQRDVIWSGVPAGPNAAVSAYRLATGERLVELPTGSSQNYTELTPDGRHLVVAARFEHRYLKIAADPASPDFGAVIAEFDTYDGAEPCDLTITADGAFAYAPDRGGDTLTAVRVEPFERAAVVPMERFAEAPLEPYMGTVSPAGDFLFIENAVVEGGPDRGSESIFDLSDPANPVEVLRLSQADGLGAGPISSEFTWDGRYGIVICRDSSELTVIDTRDLEIVRRVAFPEGSNPIAGTFASDGESFFVPLPGRDAVAVVDVPSFELRTLVAVGPRPLGAVYLQTEVPDRPAAAVSLGTALAVARTFPAGCPDACCGPV